MAADEAPDGGDECTVRPATAEDYDDVARISRETWDGDDYLQHVYHDWFAGENRQTLVAEVDGNVAGIAQMVMLSPWEAWGQGLRVDRAYRGQGVSERLTHDLFDWARGERATVARAMVFSWNQAGLGQSRATGYEPVTEFRWLRPDPRDGPMPGRVSENPDAALAYWTDSDARDHLAGLGLSLDESWAVQTVTREMLHRAADETRLLAVTDDEGTHAFTYRTRTFERESDGDRSDGDERDEDGRDDEDGPELWAEYGVAAWDDLGTAETLLDAIAVDAADLGADRTRVLVPETARYVSDGAYLRANIGDEPDFVVGADLTGTVR